MAGALTFLLIGCLLKGSLCEQFKVIMPQTVEALSGSCVTIPCSFDIDTKFDNDLDDTCKAIWKRKSDNKIVFDSAEKPGINGELRGNLKEKDCTTTLSNTVLDTSNTYYFRLECDNELKYNYDKDFPAVNILFKADPPSLTLTPSTLEVKEGTSVSLNCSAPAPCLSHPPTLTWTPNLGNSQETLQENQNKTKVKISVLTFTVSHLHHGKTISFPPQILLSSDCTKTASQVNCSCETVGNPSPILHWYLDGLPVSHSETFAVRNESLNGTGLRSIITVNQPQWRDLSTLVCHSSNSLGTASQRFHFKSLEQQISAGSEGHVTSSVFITTVVALLVLVCALLCVIRAQSRCTGDTSVAMRQFLARSEGNEAPNITEEDIYVNTDRLRQADVPHPATMPEPNSTNLPSNAEEARKISGKKIEEGTGVVYSSVNWKKKSKKKQQEESVDMDPPGGSCLVEERCMVGSMSRNFVSDALTMGNIFDEVEPRNMKRDMECEYAQVKFKGKGALHK
ncbi:sialic acid-binding Ig-like lectin 13 [Toxotes jaculatrix]|uniref:sialic acid-binding Ig-like lectin 13 n=1 Tax=Toxotes jaculatrix TaxID=941984 RepID=UPI001B3AFF5A|nr:sialic acid-binding Ig-like lectin 13 [Toxotes jaculatrix]